MLLWRMLRQTSEGPKSLYSVYIDSIILFWYCRRTASDEFLSSLLDVLQRHNPTILILVETRTHGFRAGAILSLILWLFFYQVMVLLVLKGQKVDWMLTPIYASPHSVVRSSLWQYIIKMRQCTNVPCCW